MPLSYIEDFMKAKTFPTLKIFPEVNLKSKGEAMAFTSTPLNQTVRLPYTHISNYVSKTKLENSVKHNFFHSANIF